MKTSSKKRRSGDEGEDLWAWTERQAVPAAAPVPDLHEDPSATEKKPWYGEVLRKISGRK